MVIYFTKLHRESDGSYSVAVLDLPGCFSAADSLQDVPARAEEAILCHIDGMLADGETIPRPPAERPASDLAVDLQPDEALAFIPVDLNKLDAMNKTMRLNVTIPIRTVALVDAAAKRAKVSRSRLLTQAADAYLAAAEANTV